MFAVWCPAHRARVLLFPDSILALHAGTRGICVRYRCTCGYEGVARPGPEPAAG